MAPRAEKKNGAPSGRSTEASSSTPSAETTRASTSDNSGEPKGSKDGKPLPHRPRRSSAMPLADSPTKEKPTAASDDDDEDDDDPIVRLFDCYIKPSAGENSKVYVFQFPTRDQKKPYTDVQGCCPTELRIKPETGIFEMDVPIETQANYDREKGVRYGEAFRKSDQVKSGGSHGLAGGFGIGAAQPRARGRGAGSGDPIDENEEIERLVENFDQSVRSGRALGKLTLGGQAIAKTSSTPQYMMGVFKGDQIHFTPVDDIIPLRPQLHHIDALAEESRKTGSSGGAAAGRPAEARAVHMTVKNAGETANAQHTTMAAHIRGAQEEPWKKYQWVDEDFPAAWDRYKEALFIRPDADEDVKGKGKSNEYGNELNVPHLTTNMTNEEYMDRIVPPRNADKFKGANRARKEKKEEGSKHSKPLNVDDSSEEASEEGEENAEVDEGTAMDVDADT